MADSDAIDQEANSEDPHQTLPYPKQIFFIIGEKFFETFSFFGLRAILAIYLKSKLHFKDDHATVAFHSFSMLCSFTPIFAAILVKCIPVSKTIHLIMMQPPRQKMFVLCTGAYMLCLIPGNGD